MNTINIVRYDIKMHNELDEFEDIIQSLQFTYNTGHLSLAGLKPGEINMAISSAMKVCRLNGIDTADHFRSFYVFDENNHNTYCDWRMTRQGFTLVIMNAPHTNTAIARWQWEIVSAMMQE